MSHLNQTFIPENSVLNTKNTQVPGDFSSPYTLIDWLENFKILSTDSSNYFFSYTRYLNEWFDYNKISKNDTIFYTRQIYINLLKEIALKYTTFDEKRFLSNLNFNDNQSLDVAIPFFSRKIKRICLYYSQNRDKLKNGVVRANLRGSNFGIETLIRKSIVDILETNSFESLNNNLPPLSSVIDKLHIQIEDKFDTQQYYFDVTPGFKYSNYGITDEERQKYFYLDAVEVDDKQLYDLNEAIKDAIRAYPLFVNELGFNNFTINYYLSGVNYSFLSPRDFQLYENTSIPENTNVYKYKKYYEKYMGSDLFILSGTADFKTLSSQILESSTPYKNLLNRRYPTIAHMPEKSSAIDEKYLGRFFTNNNLGILYWNTYKKKFLLNKSLSANETIVIPDPEVGFDAVGLSLKEQTLSGVGYLRDVQWNRFDWANDYGFGTINSDAKKQKFYSYLSKTELDSDIDDGISKISDYQDFWDESLVWKNQDIFSFLNDDYYPLDSRAAYLLYNQGILTKYKTDIFGNHFGFFKNSLTKSYSAVSLSAYPSYTSLKPTTLTSLSSIYERENIQKGQVYLRYYDDSSIVPLSAALSAIFIKYPTKIKFELDNSIIDFDVIFNTVIIETPKYLIFDKLNFDFDRKIFDASYTKNTYFEKYNLSSILENNSNFWYKKEYKEILFSLLTLLPENSSTNYKILYPEIYAGNIHDLNFVKIYPIEASTSALSGLIINLGTQQFNPTYCDKSLLNYNHESQVLSHLVKCYDNNLIPILLNYKFVKFFKNIELQKATAFKPCGFIFDQNYAGTNFDQTVQHVGIFSGIVGAQPQFLSFLASVSSLSGYNFYYVSEYPLTVNQGTSSFVFCDDTLTNTFDVYLGSLNLNLQDVYGTLVYDFSGSNEHFFNSLNDSITATSGAYSYTITYVASAQHVIKIIPT
jgi:hypothetical protein